jgi:tetratricopeptide (TPR) repeat protein
MVTAYSQLGEAYLDAKCFQQSLEHLTSALKLNGSLFQKLQETREFHTHILKLLGRCYMEAGNYKDALNLLDKSLSMNQQLQGQDHISAAGILMIMAQVHSKRKDHEKALELLEKIWSIAEAQVGSQSEQAANAHLEMAKIHAKKRDVEEAIDYQQKALHVYEQLEKFAGTDFLAGIST